jgi:hypothetical protein
VSVGFGLVPAVSLMGNCFAGGLAGQPQLGSCWTQTPQRIASLLETTIDCCVKSRPVESLEEWHSTQYVEKNPCAQLAHVSPEAASPPPLLLPLLPLPLDDVDPLLDPPDDGELEEQAAASAPARTPRPART